MKTISIPAVRLFSLFLILALLALPTGVSHAFVAVVVNHTVTPASTDWSFVNDNSTTGDWTSGFHNGPGTPPVGVGSAYITLSSTSAGIVLAAQKYQGTQLSNIQGLTYSTYTNLSPAAMAFQINYDPDLTTAYPKPWYGRLVYEPYVNGTVNNATWQTWDMKSGGAGKWWASSNANSTVDNTCPQASPCTWSALIAAYPNIGIRNDSSSAIQFKAGSNWNGFNGSVDNLNITIGGTTDAYNFELPADVYVNASWAGTSAGTDPDGAGPATSFGADAFDTIQAGVNGVASGGTVHVAAGTYRENVTIATPLTLAGANQATTIIQPAVSNPNCGGAGGSSLCAGASNIILVQANDVLIHHFTLDGDNPTLTSTENVGGANIDARNGIITNHLLATPYNGLEVHHVTVQNVFLRGVYASSLGSFNFHDNTVTNVRAVYASIAIFAWGGPGTIQNNTVSYANDGISANHSKGIQFLNNTVTNSGSGVHTDNAGDGGGVADLIQGNTISNCMTDGYGIFVFVPYIAPTVNNNSITNCKIGLSDWGQGAAVTPIFSNNTVNGSGLSGSIGAHASSDLNEIYGALYTDVTVSFTGNTFLGNDTGVLLTQYPGYTLNATFHTNRIAGNTSGLAKNGSPGTLTTDFMHNWWGAALGPLAADNPAGTGDTVAAGFPYSPWCINSTCTAFAPPFKYDDTDTGWTYTAGWTPVTPFPGAYQDTLHVATVPGASSSFTVTAASGSRFILTYARYPDPRLGTIGLYLDGSLTPMATLDTNGTAGLPTYTSVPLSAGAHTLTVKHEGTMGSVVAIDALEMTLPTYVGLGTYDDADANWIYTGSWSSLAMPPAYSGTLHRSTAVGDTASFSFSGGSFVLVYPTYPGLGSFEVYVDGSATPAATVNASGSIGMLTYWSPSYSAGLHTVMLKHTGATPAWIAIDAIMIRP